VTIGYLPRVRCGKQRWFFFTVIHRIFFKRQKNFKSIRSKPIRKRKKDKVFKPFRTNYRNFSAEKNNPGTHTKRFCSGHGAGFSKVKIRSAARQYVQTH